MSDLSSSRSPAPDPVYRGVFAIPVTPFDDALALDLVALRRQVEHCLEAGVHGLVTPVNVSEFFTLSDDERQTVVETTVRAADGRAPVVAGVAAASTHQAAAAARRAAAAGADAVIAMPPHVKRATWPEVVDHFGAIAEAAGVPVFVQNAEGPAGTPLGVGQVLDLVRSIPGVAWVKEETAASSQVVSALIDAGEPRLHGVMGGKGARFILDEHPRGICGTMPGCEFSALHVALWDALEGGDRDAVMGLYRVLLPLVSMEDQYGGAAFCKEVLVRRGVLRSTAVREPGSPRLDRVASDLLDRLLADADEHLAAAGVARGAAAGAAGGAAPGAVGGAAPGPAARA